MIDSAYFDGLKNINPGHRHESEPTLAELMMPLVNGDRVVRAMKGTGVPDIVIPNGSIAAPFDSIQDAVEYAEENLNPSYSEPAVVLIGPGVWSENIIIRTSGIYLKGFGIDMTKLETTGVPIVFTNATLESLETYHSSGTYSDLVNMGSAGPRSGGLSDMWLKSIDAKHCLEFLGVKGDASPTTTNFGLEPSYAGFFVENVWGTSFPNEIMYARNAGHLRFLGLSFSQISTIINVWSTLFRSCSSLSPSFSYDASDPEGTHAAGYYLDDAVFSYIYALTGSKAASIKLRAGCNVADNLILNDTADCDSQGNYCDGNVDLNGSSDLNWEGNAIGGTVNLEADSVMTTLGCTIDGNITIANGGTGSMTMRGGRRMGTTTDPGAKLTHTQGQLGS